MTLKNAFRLHTWYQVAVVVSILCAFGTLVISYYRVTAGFFVLAAIVTILGVRHSKKLNRRCRRIEQGYGDPEDTK